VCEQLAKTATNCEHNNQNSIREEDMRKSVTALTFSLAIAAALTAVATLAYAEEKQLHRVVTALDANNKSIALFNAMVPLKMGGAGEGRSDDLGDSEGSCRLFVERGSFGRAEGVLSGAGWDAVSNRRFPSGRT